MLMRLSQKMLRNTPSLKTAIEDILTPSLKTAIEDTLTPSQTHSNSH